MIITGMPVAGAATMTVTGGTPTVQVLSPSRHGAEPQAQGSMSDGPTVMRRARRDRGTGTGTGIVRTS